MQYNQTIKLKNKAPCLLRNPTSSDAAAILAHMRLTSDETEYMLRYADEIHLSVSEEEALLARMETAPDAVMISAVVDGQIVANAGLNPVMRLDKLRHRAEIGLSVQRAYWGMGIGTALMEALILCAQKIGYVQTELEVVTENARAIRLYEKLGFRVIGTNARAFLTRDGRYLAMHQMVREN